jgi:phage anti-repressor protein
MNDLTTTEKDGKRWIDARDLHANLEIGRDFSTWIKDRIEKYGFVEGKDFSPNLMKSTSNLIFPKFGENQVSSHGGKREGAGRPEVDYLLTLNAAKLIVVGENNPQSQKILLYLIKIEEAWNIPELVVARAMQMGAIPPQAMHPQLDDKGFKDALWLYSIGAITLEDLHRFRFGASAPPDERELKADPIDPVYIPYITAVRRLRELPDGEFPLTADKLEKLVRGKVSSPHIMDRLAKYETPYLDKTKLDREAAGVVMDKYFEMYGYLYRKPGGIEHPDQAKLDAMKEERERAKSCYALLGPVYVWTQKTPEEIAEVRRLYEMGAYNAEKVRQALFGGQLQAPAKALPSAGQVETKAIGGIDYDRALEVLADTKKFPTIGYRALSQICGKSAEELKQYHKFLDDPRHKWLTPLDAKRILDLAFGVMPIPKHNKGLGKKHL